MRMLVLAVLFLAQRPSSLPFQAGTITGRILNADGSAAAKVRVSAMAIPESRNGGTDAPALITLTETDSTGRYRLAERPSRPLLHRCRFRRFSYLLSQRHRTCGRHSRQRDGTSRYGQHRFPDREALKRAFS